MVYFPYSFPLLRLQKYLPIFLISRSSSSANRRSNAASSAKIDASTSSSANRRHHRLPRLQSTTSPADSTIVDSPPIHPQSTDSKWLTQANRRPKVIDGCCVLAERLVKIIHLWSFYKVLNLNLHHLIPKLDLIFVKIVIKFHSKLRRCHLLRAASTHRVRCCF